MKNVKVVIGANYGDEGKGLMTNYFVRQSLFKKEKPIVVFSNGTAQRGHTVDYSEYFRHVYHHFGSGTAEYVPTFFAETFFIHPMEFHREYLELNKQGIVCPTSYYDVHAKVITPYDMLVDRATEEWIEKKTGKKEFGSCGFGSWCAIEDRYPRKITNFTIQDFIKKDNVPILLEQIKKDCIEILKMRDVKIEETKYGKILLSNNQNIIINFINDLNFFFHCSSPIFDFDKFWNSEAFDTFIFENGQGLGLDKDIDNEWHTTSNTGIIIPSKILEGKDFNGEICYVTRSYLTRHGEGPLEEAISKDKISKNMTIDKTNVYNDFQGNLKYGFIEDTEQKKRIEKDLAYVKDNKNFTYNIAVTHTNEFNVSLSEDVKYYSDSPFRVIEQN